MINSTIIKYMRLREVFISIESKDILSLIINVIGINSNIKDNIITTVLNDDIYYYNIKTYQLEVITKDKNIKVNSYNLKIT